MDPSHGRGNPLHARGDTVDAPVAHDGAVRFARYAYPPNALGYCGPGEHAALLEGVDAGATGPGLERLARGFEGAWPYLQLLAGHTGRAPLDPGVVEAYWVGNSLTHAVPGAAFALSLADRFGRRARIDDLMGPLRHGAVLHHSYHVLAVYPWAGLLRAGRTEPSLEVIERCLVRWGTVLEVDGPEAIVDVVTATWLDGVLSLGSTRTERFTRSQDGRRLVDVRVGDTVAVHWDWVCDVLAPAERRALAVATHRNLAAVAAAHPVRMPEPSH